MFDRSTSQYCNTEMICHSSYDTLFTITMNDWQNPPFIPYQLIKFSQHIMIPHKEITVLPNLMISLIFILQILRLYNIFRQIARDIVCVTAIETYFEIVVLQYIFVLLLILAKAPIKEFYNLSFLYREYLMLP